MLSNQLKRSLEKKISQHRYLYVPADDTQEQKFLYKTYTNHWTGPVYLHIATVPSHFANELNFQSVINSPSSTVGRAMTVNVHNGRNGLFIVDESKNSVTAGSIRKHRGYLNVTFKAGEHLSRRASLLADHPELTDYRWSSIYAGNAIGLIVYYLSHNLYWNGRRYMLHDHKFLRQLAGSVAESVFINTAILALKPLFDKFCFAKNWKLSSGVIGRVKKQLDLFHQQPVRSGQAMDINPSRFVHQLAAVNEGHAISVRLRSDKEIKKIAKEHNSKDDISWICDHPSETFDHSNYQVPQNRFRLTWANSELLQHDSTKPLKWRPVVRQIKDCTSCPDVYKRLRDPILVNQYAQSNFDLTPKIGTHHVSKDILVNDPKDIQKIAHTSHIPSGSTYNCVQVGPHLFDVVYQENRLVSDDPRPAAVLPICAQRGLLNCHPTTVRSNCSQAVAFGNPGKIRYRVTTMKKFVSSICYYQPTVQLNPVVFRDDQAKEIGINDDEDVSVLSDSEPHPKRWLQKNAGYRHYIASL